MAHLLSRNGIASLHQGIRLDNPCFQITELKPIQMPNQPDRWRMMLADGVNQMQAMTSTNFDSNAHSGSLRLYAILQLTSYEVKQIKDGRLIIILKALNVVDNSVRGKLGDPQQLPNPEGYPNSSYGQQQQQQQQQQQHQHQQQQHGQYHQNQQFHQNQTQHSYYNQGRPQQYGEPKFTPKADGFFASIASLNPYQNKWTIKARVTKKNMREYTNNRGKGWILNVDLIDNEGTEIRATAFQDAAEKFNQIFEENNVYTISRAEVRVANPKFNPFPHDYDLSLNMSTEVSLASEDHSIPKMVFKAERISTIQEMEPNRTVDIVGVLIDIDECGSITTKNGDPLSKRQLTIADNSDCSIVCTIWGKRAEEFSMNVGTILGLKGAKVGDYGGRTLSLPTQGIIEPNPDVPESYNVRAWYDETHAQGVHPLSSSFTPGSGGGNYAPLEKITCAEVKSRVMQQGTAKFMLQGTITLSVHNREQWYEACQGRDPNDPKRQCNKKVEKLGPQGYNCEKCHGSYQDADVKYILNFRISDHTGVQWATAFGDVGEQIVGRPARELKEYRDSGNETKFEEILKEYLFKIYNFRCTAKLDNNVEYGPRVKVTVHAVTVPNWIAEMKELVKGIEQMEMY